MLPSEKILANLAEIEEKIADLKQNLDGHSKKDKDWPRAKSALARIAELATLSVGEINRADSLGQRLH